MQRYPKTQYTERDGAQIAYQIIGSGSVDFIYSVGMISNFEHYWDIAEATNALEQLATYFRIILFDRRGSGHSDPLPTNKLPTWEDWSDDLLAVLDAAGSRRAVIHGERDGGAMALMFAAMHPDRTQVLSLGNTTARYLIDEDYPCGNLPESAQQIEQLFREKWGTDEFTLMFLPRSENDPHSLYMRSRQSRGAATPRQAATYVRYALELDARQVLPSIQVPTLVFQRTNQALFTLEQGRYLADNIPNARFIELPGSEVSILVSDSAPQFHKTLIEFVTGTQSNIEFERSLTAILFCDVVDSTKRAAALGDAGWNQLLAKFYTVVRREITRHGGKEVDTAGDGFFIAFDRPTRAVNCAMAIRDAVKAIGLQIRGGIHIGECTTSGNKLTGMAVHVGARIASAAKPDEVWVSETIKALTLGSGINFSERGKHELKGVPDRWSLYAAS